MGNYVVTLDRTHDVKAFDCGTPALNTWLQTIARQHQEKSLSQTFVLVDDDNPAAIIGFYALSIREMTPREVLPPELAKKLPSALPGYTIARLAVDIKATGKGYGADILIDAMLRIKRVSDEVGGPFIFVDAKDQKAADFYMHHGFTPFPDDSLTLTIPMSAIDDA